MLLLLLLLLSQFRYQPGASTVRVHCIGQQIEVRMSEKAITKWAYPPPLNTHRPALYLPSHQTKICNLLKPNYKNKIELMLPILYYSHPDVR